MIRARGPFFFATERPQPLAGNDNRVGDESFSVRALVSEQLTYTLAIFSRVEETP